MVTVPILKDNKIIVVMPIFNEGHSLARQIEELFSTLNKFNWDYYLVLVDDGSTDASVDILKSYENKENVILIHHYTNMGLGKALLSGLSKAKEISDKKDIIITMESDNTNELSCLVDMANAVINNCDVAICSRLNGCGGFIGFPTYRKVMTIVLNKLLKLLFPYGKLNDYSMIYRAYNAGLIKDLFKRYGNLPIKFSGFASVTEILLKLIFLKSGIKIKEFSVTYRYDLKQSKSKMNIFQTIKEYFILIYIFYRDGKFYSNP